MGEYVKSFLRATTGFRKCTELVISSICLGLALDACTNGAISQCKNIRLTYATSSSFIIINAVIVLCLIMGQILPDFALLTFCGAGGILFTLSGQEALGSWISLEEYQPSADDINKDYAPPYGWITGMNQLRATGLLCLLLGMFYTLDALITLYSQEKEKNVPAPVISPPNKYRFRKPYSLYTYSHVQPTVNPTES